MKIVKNILAALHTSKSFKKNGFKQATTWLGFAIFACVFDKDLLILVHNILTDSNLAEKIAAGLAGSILVAFNKSKGG